MGVFVKYEEVYLPDDASPRDAYRGLTRYFTFYNEKRLHQALEYRTPAEQYQCRGTAEGTPLARDPSPNASRRTHAERPAPSDADAPRE